MYFSPCKITWFALIPSIFVFYNLSVHVLLIIKDAFSIPLLPIYLGDSGAHYLISVWIDGGYHYMLLDTGASKTVFDTSFYEAHPTAFEGYLLSDDTATGLSTNELNFHESVLKAMRLSALTITNYHVAVIDLSHLVATYEKTGNPAVVGVIGTDIIYQYRFMIDIAGRVVYVRR